MRVARAQAMGRCLAERVFQQRFHEPFAQAPATVRWIDDDIAEISKGGLIADRTGESDLAALME